MNTLLQDIRYGLRTLRKSPGFTAVAVITIALGAGLNIAVFTLLYKVVLQPLPYPDAERLAVLELNSRGRVGQTGLPWSYPQFARLESDNRVFESVTALAARDFTVTGRGYPERVSGEWASWSYFRVLGIQARMGRVFVADDERGADAAPVALISTGLWKRMFASSSAAIGETIRLNEVPFTIIGVLPKDFRGDSERADVFVPLTRIGRVVSPTLLRSDGTHWLRIVGRLKPGTNFAQAGREVSRLLHELAMQSSALGTEWAAAVPLSKAKSDPAVLTSISVLSGAVVFCASDRLPQPVEPAPGAGCPAATRNLRTARSWSNASQGHSPVVDREPAAVCDRGSCRHFAGISGDGRPSFLST